MNKMLLDEAAAFTRPSDVDQAEQPVPYVPTAGLDVALDEMPNLRARLTVTYPPGTLPESITFDFHGTDDDATFSELLALVRSFDPADAYHAYLRNQPQPCCRQATVVVDLTRLAGPLAERVRDSVLRKIEADAEATAAAQQTDAPLATGGPVMGASAYLVGDRGPEWIGEPGPCESCGADREPNPSGSGVRHKEATLCTAYGDPSTASTWPGQTPA